MLSQIFTWWNSKTFGASFTLWRRGAELVGEDEQGNKYYEEKKAPSLPGATNRPRRWVIYHGVSEASRVTPDWHGWLHHTFDEPPTVAPLKRRDFEQDHLPNMTGTPLAYHPKGSLEHADRGHVGKEYEAWSPDTPS